MQAIANDRDLIKLVSGIDVYVSGGGSELLLSGSVPTTTQLIPGNTTPVYGTYPLTQTDAASRTVYIVTTTGSFRYLGRVDAQFDAAGEVTKIITETSYIRRVIPTSSVATQLGLPDAVTPDANIVSTVETPLNSCLSTFASTVLFASQVQLSVARPDVRAKEANGGNLIADSFLYAYDQLASINGLPPRSASNYVVSVQNGGGIRDTVSGVYPRNPATPTVSLLDTLDVLPFANFVTVVTDITPSDVKSIFERSASGYPSAFGGFLQVSGITVTYRMSNAVNGRVWNAVLPDGTSIVASGVVISTAPKISIVTNDFTATGGDGFVTLQNNPNRVRLKDATGALISYGDAWRSYMQTFPLTTVLGQSLPTVLSTDKRYQPGGEGRLIFGRSFWYFPIASSTGSSPPPPTPLPAS
jgi:5'-nucleotidase